MKPNFRIIPSKKTVVFSVFIARKEGQSFVQFSFFFCCVLFMAKEKLVENMSQNHHNLITSFFLWDYNYCIY